jgi:hypothetical protein
MWIRQVFEQPCGQYLQDFQLPMWHSWAKPTAN